MISINTNNFKFAFLLINARFFLTSFNFVCRECSNALTARKWTNESHKVHFESGVHVGIGAFNLVKHFYLILNANFYYDFLFMPVF